MVDRGTLGPIAKLVVRVLICDVEAKLNKIYKSEFDSSQDLAVYVTFGKYDQAGYFMHTEYSGDIETIFQKG